MDGKIVKQKIGNLYWHENVNCATAILKVLAENYSIQLDSQIIDAAIGMHGAGGYRAQCGLVEGTLMFIGVLGRERGIETDKIVDLCFQFAQNFEAEFKSLICQNLRPEGFSANNPPHLCESLTNRAAVNAIDFLNSYLNDVVISK